MSSTCSLWHGHSVSFAPPHPFSFFSFFVWAATAPYIQTRPSITAFALLDCRSGLCWEAQFLFGPWAGHWVSFECDLFELSRRWHLVNLLIGSSMPPLKTQQLFSAGSSLSTKDYLQTFKVQMNLPADIVSRMCVQMWAKTCHWLQPEVPWRPDIASSWS